MVGCMRIRGCTCALAYACACAYKNGIEDRNDKGVTATLNRVYAMNTITL